MTTRTALLSPDEIETASTIHNMEKGIPLANANPIRPNVTVYWGSVTDTAIEIVRIHPAVVKAMMANR